MERPVRYIFPFVDRRWRVPFVVVDFLEVPPKILEGPFRLDNYRYRTTMRISQLRPVESVTIEELRALVHYDPWWVFRWVSGVESEWVEAVFATNLARPFRHDGRTLKIQDLVFSSQLDRLVEIDARGGMLRSVTFHPGEIDLLALRPTPKGTPAPQIARRAKAL